MNIWKIFLFCTMFILIILYIPTYVYFVQDTPVTRTDSMNSTTRRFLTPQGTTSEDRGWGGLTR